MNGSNIYIKDYRLIVKNKTCKNKDSPVKFVKPESKPNSNHYEHQLIKNNSNKYVKTLSH